MALCDQIDGVAMGSPLGPLFADIFLCSHEWTWLNNYPSDFKPLYNRRYVDDCFVLFRSSDHVLPFLNYLNSPHRNINFTFEYENDSIHFLDILINRSVGTFLTSVCRKPTFTVLLTNFNSFIPFTYKKGLIYSVLNRCFRICSTYPTFLCELEKLKRIFISNAFPARLVDSCFNSFLHKVSLPIPKRFTVPKRLIYFSLAFTGIHFLQIQTQLRKLFLSAFPHITIRFVPRPTVRVSNFFSLKDRIPTRLRSHVVYKFTCQGCGALYVGETSQHLQTQVSDHLGISALTGKKRRCPSHTAILSHHTETLLFRSTREPSHPADITTTSWLL